MIQVPGETYQIKLNPSKFPDVNINSRINVHFVLFLTYGGIKKKLLHLLLQFSLSKRDNSHTIEKKVTSFITIFLDISL
jgi:hypothetical protein